MRRGATILKRVASVILGGGQGSRLFPLTENRSKPAVSFGGKYRLIDIPISNSLNSGVRKIFVLTQFLSAGLHRHITRTYRMDGFSDGFVEILAAEQTPTNTNWYQGTADAVRQSLRYLRRVPVEHILVLSGDQLYKMDFRDMLETHLNAEADITLAATLIPESDVPRMGILRIDDDGRVIGFEEKPDDPETIRSLAVPEGVRGAVGGAGTDRRHFASMGIYIFRRNALIRLLEEDETKQDFGREVIPAAFDRTKVVCHPFNGYWEDVGTLRSFFEANLDLAGTTPKFDLYDPVNPLFSRPRYLPAPKIQDSRLDQALVAEGSIIEGATLSRVVIGLRSVVRAGSRIRNSILIGNNTFGPGIGEGMHPPEVGRNVTIENAVIDKNAVIGDGCVIEGKPGAPDRNEELYYLRDGIVVIPDGRVLPPGTKIRH